MSSPEAIKHSMFLMALGSVTLNWSSLEMYLDGITVIIHKNVMGHTIEKDAPTSLKRKTEFIKKCLKSIPELDAYKILITEFVTEVNRLKEKRHDLIHGALAGHSYNKNTTTRLSRIINSKRDIKEYSYCTKDIELLSDEIYETTQKSYEWVIRFFNDFSKPL